MSLSYFLRRHWLTLALLTGCVVLLTVSASLIGDRLVERVTVNLCINIVLVIGLQVFMGNSGILSFAHIGFMGVGAYSAALLTIPSQMKNMALPELYPVLADLSLDPLLAIFVGGLIAAVIAMLVSYPLMRLSDAAAVITSFALLVVLHTVMLHWSEVTNGPRTLFGLPKYTGLLLAASAAILAIWIGMVFKESRIGLLLRASRSDEIGAAAIGANIPQMRWMAFILGAFLAGIGGGLWGHFITSFAPKAFFLKETFVILGMLIIGGPRTVTGAVMGTLIVTATFEGLRAFENGLNRAELFSGQVIGLTEIVLALAMIAVLILRPGGLFPAREIGTLITLQRQK